MEWQSNPASAFLKQKTKLQNHLFRSSPFLMYCFIMALSSMKCSYIRSSFPRPACPYRHFVNIIVSGKMAAKSIRHNLYFNCVLFSNFILKNRWGSRVSCSNLTYLYIILKDYKKSISIFLVIHLHLWLSKKKNVRSQGQIFYYFVLSWVTAYIKCFSYGNKIHRLLIFRIHVRALR